MRISLRDLLLPEEFHCLTRDFGKEFYPRIVPYIRNLPELGVLWVEVPEGLLMDYSFADETLGRVLEELVDGRWGDRYLVASVNTELQFDNLAASVRLRGIPAWVKLREEIRLVMRNDLRGKEELKETVDLVNLYRRVTASDLARNHGLNITAWNNRLARAYRLRLIRRTPEILSGGGRLYVYESLFQLD